MGIGVVLLVYLVIMLAAASVCSAVLTGFTAWLLKASAANRIKPLWFAGSLPFACVIFAGVWFVLYAAVNETVFHRDPGFGDSWETPLPNGYALAAIDVTDFGALFNPRSGDVNQQGSIDGITRLQVSGNQIFGALDSQYSKHFGQPLVDDEFFALDTTSGKRTAWRAEADLRSAMTNEHIIPNLRPFSDVFSEYRQNWFDGFAAATGLLIPAATIVLFVHWLFRLRKRHELLKVA